MADIVDLMLATGARIDEIFALRWIDVALDVDRPSLTFKGIVKTEAGKGYPSKGQHEVGREREEGRAVRLRHNRAQAPPGGSTRQPDRFRVPTRNGTWQQVNNAERR